MILSSSLHKSNVIFVFRDPNLPAPENHDFMSLFGGEEGKGTQFVDDPFMRMKILDASKLGIQVAWEGRRLRIEDLAAREPETSLLAERAVSVLQKLFPATLPRLESFGFNVEVYYQNSDVIQIQEMFKNVIPEPFEIGEGLLDFGWQWTKAHKNGRQVDGYFLKVTAPLELVIHHNAHFNESEIPDEKRLINCFSSMYEQTHVVAKSLKL